MDERRGSVASEDTFVDLQQLDPSPIDSPPDWDEKLPQLPSHASFGRSSTLGLSGSGHGAVYYLTRIQRYSSYAFSVFSAMHITNTSLIPLITRSVSASEKYLLLTRPYYQSLPLEPLIIGIPLAAHITSGIALRLYRRRVTERRYSSYQPTSFLSYFSFFSPKFWPPVSYTSISGYILTPIVASHIFVNRVIPLIHEGGSSSVGLGYVSHGFALHPTISWTTYVALVGIGASHMVWGAAKWLGLLPRGTEKERGRIWWGLNGIVGFVGAVWFAGGLGVIARGGAETGWVGSGYDALYQRVPLLA
ncbi:hypothetical protein sscle_07g059080 [Sclerotinia sclerotiorum 1980 UF-70]|uniref:Mitochondrial adapter protein MCP1 transmembrane domain-containing protein n=1 Tax=Sclerotinia sclerotiorum (strain ATCC 18683 / 1980 / Ss-1) TaxID=665079 RepID=A0A1D9Q866_SCLS1|nr:hypothetical protein sscle_07g059080 [Sclerotinia sclerotiorum 1980 UF-70]